MNSPDGFLEVPRSRIGTAVVGSLGCALTRLGQDEREQPRALLAASPRTIQLVAKILRLVPTPKGRLRC